MTMEILIKHFDMSKSSAGGISNKDLYEELQSAIEQDKLYWIRNNAKLKAVTTVNTYDEFRDRVAAAHLKPLSRAEMKHQKQTSWNKAATLE